MAEGGCAASMGNVNPNDNWQVHFRDTMRGGKFLNNWRMAELHAKEAPDRVWELETYGALFDRTKDGKISQRNFGGHTYPRLAHVGDRTGLEMIRTLQQKIVSLQQEDYGETGDYEANIRVFHETHDHRPVQGRRQDRGLLRLLPQHRRLRPLRGARGRAGHRRHRQDLQGHVELLGVHRRRPRAGAARGRHADQHGVPPVPPDGHGLAAVGEGDPRHRVGARRRRRPQELRGQAVHVRLHPGRVQGAVRHHARGGRPLVHRRRQQPAPARAAAPRRGGPRHQLRGQGRPRQPARRRVPRHRLPALARGDPQEAAVDVPPVQGAGRRRHHQGADGGRPDLPLRDGRRRGRPGHRDVDRPGAVRRGRGARAACTAPTGWAATRCRTCWCSAAGPGSARPSTSTASAGVRPPCSAADVDAAQERALLPFSSGDRRRGEPVQGAAGAAADDARAGRHHPQGRRDAPRAEEARGHRDAHPHRVGRRGTASSTRAGTWRSTCATCCWCR